MFGNLGKIMQVVGNLKHKMPEMKKKLEESRYVGQAGGSGVGVSGEVKAVVNGKLALVELAIDASLLNSPHVTSEMLAEMVKAAVNAAQDIAATAAAEAMKELTGGIEIPGMDLSGM